MNNRKLTIALIVSLFLFAVFIIVGVITYLSFINDQTEKDTVIPHETSEIIESRDELSDSTKTPEPVVTPTPTPQPVYPLDGWIVSDNVSIRTSPSTQSDIITQASDSEEISLTEKVDGQDENFIWFEVEYEEYTGFVREDFIALTKPTFAESMVKGIYVEDAIDGKTKYTQLVYVKDIAPNVLIDLTLAYEDNFIGPKLYAKEVAMIQLSTGILLNEASKILENQGYQIMLWDGYRPYSASVTMFEYIGDPDMVADPKRGSRHNRGSAVDVTLYKDGKPIDMPTDLRYLDVKHSAIKSDMTTTERENYEILADAMMTAGFTTYKNEWWHFNDPDYEGYPVMDFSLDMF